MSPVKAIAILVLCAFALPAFPKGITVRFLSSPAEDSIVSYEVMRSDAPDKPCVGVGRVTVASASDTLAFADSGAARGHAYVYSIVGINGEGGRSEPSESTQVALPILSLPDTLRAAAAGAAWILAPDADPLAGLAPLSLSLSAADTARVSLAFDPLTRKAILTPRHPETAWSGWIGLSADYFGGKFSDRDSLWLVVPGAAPVAARLPRSGIAAAFSLPAQWSPSAGAMRLSAATAGRVDLVTAGGEIAASINLTGNGSEVLWDGRDAHGRALKPACYLWAARGARGAMLGSGSLRLLP